MTDFNCRDVHMGIVNVLGLCRGNAIPGIQLKHCHMPADTMDSAQGAGPNAPQ